MKIPTTSIPALIERHDAILLDAFGVLVETAGLLPGAVALLDHLAATGVPYMILTNDASRTHANAVARLQSLGLKVSPDQLLTSGSLVAEHFAREGLQGAGCLVLGPPDAHEYVAAAGGDVRQLEGLDDDAVDVVVVADDRGYPFIPTVEAVLSIALRRLDAGRPLRLIVPNPDLIYPRGGGDYGITSGGVAVLLEAAIAVRYPDAPGARFERLGKPHAPIFEVATRRLGCERPVMIGDQVQTDIRGARAFGMAAALVSTGVGRFDVGFPADAHPTYLLPSLAL